MGLNLSDKEYIVSYIYVRTKNSVKLYKVRTDRSIDRSIDRQTDRSIDRSIDRQTDRWFDVRQTYKEVLYSFL